MISPSKLNQEVGAKYEAARIAENEAFLKGEEVADRKILLDAKDEGGNRTTVSDASRAISAGLGGRAYVPRDHSGAPCWPPFHDPREEPRWLKESGCLPPPEPAVPAIQPGCFDQHVKDHMEATKRIQTVVSDLQAILEYAWTYQTGESRSVGETPAGSGSNGSTSRGVVDHKKAATDYLTSTFGWDDRLWPVVVAVGDGQAKKSLWGNRKPEWPTARRLWARLTGNLMKRLERQPFAAYIEDLERTEAYSGRPDDLREEAARLAEIDAKYARRA